MASSSECKTKKSAAHCRNTGTNISKFDNINIVVEYSGGMRTATTANAYVVYNMCIRVEKARELRGERNSGETRKPKTTRY